MAKRPLLEAKKDIDFTSARYKAILEKFPDATITESWGYGRESISTFSSKQVNTNYTKLNFEPGYRGIVAIPYCEVSFTHDDTEHVVKIHSIPKSSRLVYIPWREKIIKFSRLSFNLKNNQFSIKDEMLNECRVQIMQFIQAHPGYKLDEKYLEPRLKKLLMFT